MNPFALLSKHLRSLRHQLAELLALKWKHHFYLYLAGLFSVLIIADATFLHLAANMKQGAFDMMVRYRLVVPNPDKDIIIVDINEASLAAMAKDYGRWPWPRQVLGEFVEQIEKQQPQAIVFDILFSDPDVFNPDSDAYFNAAIADTTNTFFPMLRLDPADDRLSQIKPQMIPGVKRSDGLASEDAKEDATIAIVLPFFKAAQEGGRLGTHNVYPDSDGIARQYPVYLDDYGWKIPSLPLRISQQLNFAQPTTKQVLLNWRGPPFTYQSVSFSDVFSELTSKQKKRPANEFTGKIVIIGSTAPSLFDIKATPISRMHPGVEILATAIDNFKHNDFLRFPDARITYLLLALVVIWATAFAFYRDVGRERIDKLFGASQFILIGISYASINFTTVYINLTGPVTVGLVFFTIARLYAFTTSKALEQNTVRSSQRLEGSLQGVLLLINLEAHADLLNEAVREKIRLGLQKAGRKMHSVEMLKGDQRGIWDLFENTLVISWLRTVTDEAANAAIKQDIEEIEKLIEPLVQKHCVLTTVNVRWTVHEGPVAGGEDARNSWRQLFAEALQRWNIENGAST